MHMRTVLVLALALVLGSCTGKVTYPPEIQLELNKLDLALDKKEEIEADKKARLDEIRSRITADSDLNSLFDCYNDLYYAFQKFNTDSSLHYARRKLSIAEKSGIQEHKDDALMNIVESFTMSCMYTEASLLLDKLDTSRLSERNKVQFYHRKRLLYSGLAENCEDDSLKTAYLNRSRYYVDKVLEELDRENDSYYHVTSERLAEMGRYDDAIFVLRKHQEKTDRSMNSRAITCYLMAQCYARKGDTDNAILYYTISSTLDLETPIYGYRSLCELSVMLYELGDIERSYRYMVRSFEDITKSNHMSCLQSLYSMTPIVSKAYDEQNARKNRQLTIFITALSTAFILLLIIIYAYAKQKRQTNGLNRRLVRYIDRLKESNDIKESYLGKYLDMCSDYIEGLARYRSNLRHIAKEKGTEELSKALKSTAFIDSELKRFYSEFDATFLALFPLFTTQLNQLLQEDKRIDLTACKGGMTTELRIMALIRLGITDSAQIARFLRRSTSTIYNYRVKMRNAALGDRDEFEKKLMKIGKIS